MTGAVKLHIRERRRVELSGVLNYLQNPKQDDFSAETGSKLHIPNKNIIKKHEKITIEKLNSVDNENIEDMKQYSVNFLRRIFYVNYSK